MKMRLVVVSSIIGYMLGGVSFAVLYMTNVHILVDVLLSTIFCLSSVLLTYWFVKKRKHLWEKLNAIPTKPE